MVYHNRMIYLVLNSENTASLTITLQGLPINVARRYVYVAELR